MTSIKPYLLIRIYGYLVVCLLCSAARVAESQLSARDTAALVRAVAEQIHAQFGMGIAREPFVVVARDTLALEDVRFVARVTAVINTRDSSLIVAVPARSTTRMHLSAPTLAGGDTVKVPLYRSSCRGTPPVYTYNNESLQFRRVGDHWVYIERYSGNGGANGGCPW